MVWSLYDKDHVWNVDKEIEVKDSQLWSNLSSYK